MKVDKVQYLLLRPRLQRLLERKSLENMNWIDTSYYALGFQPTSHFSYPKISCQNSNRFIFKVIMLIYISYKKNTKLKWVLD